MINIGKWRLHPVSRRTLPVFSGALICLSYTAVVPPHGFAPRSSAYKADALTLSYGGGRGVAGASRARLLVRRPASRLSDLVKLGRDARATDWSRMLQLHSKNGRVPRCRPGYLLVPSEADCCLPRTRLIVGKLVAEAGFEPAVHGV